MPIKKLLSLFALIGVLAACSPQPTEFTITNNSDIDRTDEPVVISRQAIESKSGKIPSGKIPLPHAGETVIPAQADDMDLDGHWDELAFTLNIPAGQSQTIRIEWVDEADYPQFKERTNVRFGVRDERGVNPVDYLVMTADELPVPLLERFQMDGPAWENDKAGFRQYIDGRNGQDFFGKTIPEMALDTVGIAKDGNLEDNYHVMLPWGRDILGVGNSLGMGGIAILENGQPKRLGVRLTAERNNVDSTIFRLIKEGPVRSIFTINYKGWDTGAGKVNLQNKVTIWAGKYGYQSTISLDSAAPTDTLLIGLVNIHNDMPPVLMENADAGWNVFFTHDKQTYDKGWYLGMGLIFPSANYLDYTRAPDSGPGITNTYLLQLELTGNKAFTYHIFAGWEISDERFSDREYFQDFMLNEQYLVSNPVEIE